MGRQPGESRQGGAAGPPRRKHCRFLAAAEGLENHRAENPHPSGEIDLVARRFRTVAFVEVKSRSSQGQSELSLDYFRLRRVKAAASAIGHHYVREGDDLRIDAIFIVPGRLPRHLVNAGME